MRAMERHKKLIEVALPLAAINKETAREKSIRHIADPMEAWMRSAQMSSVPVCATS